MSTIASNDIVYTQPYPNFNDPNFDPYALDEKDQAAFEKTLNILGYIPLVSSFSGAIRIISSVITLVSSAVKGPLCAIADLFQKTPRGYSFRLQKHITYMGHSWANMFRGAIEFAFVFGNILTFSYDRLIGRIRYPVEHKI